MIGGVLALALAAQAGGTDFACSIPGGARLQGISFHLVAPADKSRRGYRTNAVQRVRADGSVDASFVSDFDTIEDALPARLSLGWRYTGKARASLTITDLDAAAGTARFALAMDQTGALASLGPIVEEGSCAARTVTQ